jgi:hypothetical protein
MNRLRHLATLLLVTAFAVFQLLSTAPVLCRCNLLALTFRGPGAPTVDVPEEASSESTNECPGCMVSGLSAVLSPGVSVFAPSVRSTAASLPVDTAVRVLLGEALRSRAPPSV